MLKDRAQKAQALRLCIAKSWLPQLEVNVEPSQRLEKTKYLLTDLDVLAITKDSLGTLSKVVFDCKSSPKESPIGRTFWLKGVMEKVGANHGFVVLNDRINISQDHRASASELSITLVRESEISLLSKGLGGTPITLDAPITDMDAWESFFSIDQKYLALRDFSSYARSGFWMIKDPGEQCRKCVGKLRSINGELDPTKEEHLAVFGEALSLFILAVSNLANKLFLVLIKPQTEEEFTITLLALLYGGYDNLDVALKIRRITAAANPSDHLDIFPEMKKFEHLVREMLEAPHQALDIAVATKDAALASLIGSKTSPILNHVLATNPYASKFILLAADYLCKATRVPEEFRTHYYDMTLTSAKQIMTATTK